MLQLLFDSIAEGNIELVKNILNEDIDINFQYDGNNAMNIVIENYFYGPEYSEIAKLLISKGFNINCESMWHISSLYYVSEKGYLELVKILLDNEANI
jgi:ankyrin repeat protein